MARLLPPENTSLKDVALSANLSGAALKRWRSETLPNPVQRREWAPGGQVRSGAGDSGDGEARKSAWCRSNDLYPHELAVWHESANMRSIVCPGQHSLHTEQRPAKARLMITRIDTDN